MRHELLADRPTQDQAFTIQVERTLERAHDSNAPVARTSGARIPMAHTTPIARVLSAMSTARTRLSRPSIRTTFLVVLAAYVALTAAVVVGSPLDVIDRAAAMSDLAHRFPNAAPWVLKYVVLGQRGPSSHVAFVYLAWRAIRQRSWRPLVLLVTALFMLNLTVGTVKIAIGRLGPALTTHPRAVFDGGDIFPSGHTSNAVVIFGVVAMVAVEHRKAMVALAVTVATTIGLSTIFLDTHWVTDVLGGWFAGALVLLALPATYARLEHWSLRATHTISLRVTHTIKHATVAIKEWFRPGPQSRQAGQPAHEATSDLLTEDAMSR